MVIEQTSIYKVSAPYQVVVWDFSTMNSITWKDESMKTHLIFQPVMMDFTFGTLYFVPTKTKKIMAWIFSAISTFVDSLEFLLRAPQRAGKFPRPSPRLQLLSQHPPLRGRDGLRHTWSSRHQYTLQIKILSSDICCFAFFGHYNLSKIAAAHRSLPRSCSFQELFQPHGLVLWLKHMV